MKEDTIFLTNIQRVIHENLSNQNLKGEFIAEQLGMSRMQLHRKLKQLTNQNSGEYITNLRINYAKQQLESTTKFVYQIAEECGFNDYTYFSRIFKKITGYSPSCFKKMYN